MKQLYSGFLLSTLTASACCLITNCIGLSWLHLQRMALLSMLQWLQATFILGVSLEANLHLRVMYSQVWPYWAYTYSPDPFQPKALPEDENWGDGLGRCPGFENDPEHYECRPQPQGWSNCWKCPPKDPSGGGYTAYRAARSRTHHPPLLG